MGNNNRGGRDKPGHDQISVALNAPGLGGSGGKELSIGGQDGRMLPSRCLDRVAVELGQQQVTAINCAQAVGPLVAALAKEGWMVEAPQSSPCTVPANTRSISEHV